MATHQMHPLSSVVVWRFVATAILWLVPALLLLPFALVFLAISVAASDGSLIEIGAGIRGNVVTALGPLLILSGIVACTLAWRWRADTADWINIGAFSGIAIVIGFLAIRHSLRRIARQLTQSSR